MNGEVSLFDFLFSKPWQQLNKVLAFSILFYSSFSVLTLGFMPRQWLVMVLT
jgi:hypothetical protein